MVGWRVVWFLGQVHAHLDSFETTPLILAQAQLAQIAQVIDRLTALIEGWTSAHDGCPQPDRAPIEGLDLAAEWVAALSQPLAGQVGTAERIVGTVSMHCRAVSRAELVYAARTPTDG